MLTALSLGGVWNGDAVPFSRAFGLGVALSVVLLLAGIFGLRRMAEIFGRGFAIWLTVLAALSILVALGSGTSLGTRALIAIPGAGILRDAQKPLVLLAIWFAVAAPLGLLGWIATISQPAGRRALVVLCALAPLLAMPDFAWGVAGAALAGVLSAVVDRLRSKLGEHSGRWRPCPGAPSVATAGTTSGRSRTLCPASSPRPWSRTGRCWCTAPPRGVREGGGG